MEEAQKKLPQVKCDGAKLKNVAWFKYLGFIFTVDGSQPSITHHTINEQIFKKTTAHRLFSAVDSVVV